MFDSKTVRWLAFLSFVLAAACGGGDSQGPEDASGHVVEDHRDSPEANPPVVVTTVPASVFGAERRPRDRECIAEAPHCEDERNECAPQQLDEPDEEIESRGGLSSELREGTAEIELQMAGGFWDSVKKIWTNGISNGGKDVTLDTVVYSGVPGYRILFDCEKPDQSFLRHSHAGGTAVDAHVSSCLLETSKGRGKVALRVRDANDRDVIPAIETQLSAPDLIWPEFARFKQGTHSLELEGGLRLMIAFFTPGTQSEGLAADKRLLHVYLTSSKDHWMMDMPGSFAGMPLRRWSLPGSHDAGMYTARVLSMLPVVDNFAVTQDLSTFEQLRVGVRYFDVRPAYATIHPFIDDVYAVHGPIPGGKYAEMLDDALRFLRDVGRHEVVIFRLTDSGITNPPWQTRHARFQVRLEEALRRAGLPRSFVGDELSLNLSPAELRLIDKRFIVLDHVRINSSWVESINERPAILPGHIRGELAACSNDTARNDGFASELQLQATAPHAIVSTLLGNKLMLDRSYFPLLAGGFAPCAIGPTIFLNDYVDNGLTDVIARGQSTGGRIVRAERGAILRWKAGELDWSGPSRVESDDWMLSRGVAGDFSVHRLARDRNTQAICNRRQMWSAPERGTRVVFQSDGNLVVYDGDVAKWASDTVGTGATLVMDSKSLSIVDKDNRTKWQASLLSLDGDGLSCDAPARVSSRPGLDLDWLGVGKQSSATHALTFQDDNNLVLLEVTRAPNGDVCDVEKAWASDTSGKGAKGPGRLLFDRTGNLALYDAKSAALWQSNTSGNKSDLILGEDGLTIELSGGKRWRVNGDAPRRLRGTTCGWRELDSTGSTESVRWKRGELSVLKNHVIGATRDTALAYEGGRLVLYRVARAESGAVCARKRIWDDGAPETDDNAFIRFDADGLTRKKDSKVLWRAAAPVADTLLLRSGELSVRDANDRMQWTTGGLDNTALTCSSQSGG